MHKESQTITSTQSNLGGTSVLAARIKTEVKRVTCLGSYLHDAAHLSEQLVEQRISVCKIASFSCTVVGATVFPDLILY